ncbi:MAG: glucosaminidase domain-containing protein [Actinomycetota bacterium]
MKTFRQISSGLGVVAGCNTAIRKLKFRMSAGRDTLRSVLLVTLFLITACEVPGGMPAMTEDMEQRAEKDLFYFQVRYLPFSEELLVKCLKLEGIKYQDVVLLQSRLETGYYTSDIFLNGNNLFGMKYPAFRPTVATGVYKDHARYEHWSDSVIDYALWQQYYMSRGYLIGDGQDSDFYLVFLKSIPYAEDKRYVSKLVRLSKGDIT